MQHPSAFNNLFEVSKVWLPTKTLGARREELERLLGNSNRPKYTHRPADPEILEKVKQKKPFSNLKLVEFVSREPDNDLNAYCRMVQEFLIETFPTLLKQAWITSYQDDTKFKQVYKAYAGTFKDQALRIQDDYYAGKYFEQFLEDCKFFVANGMMTLHNANALKLSMQAYKDAQSTPQWYKRRLFESLMETTKAKLKYQVYELPLMLHKQNFDDLLLAYPVQFFQADPDWLKYNQFVHFDNWESLRLWAELRKIDSNNIDANKSIIEYLYNNTRMTACTWDSFSLQKWRTFDWFSSNDLMPLDMLWIIDKFKEKIPLIIMTPYRHLVEQFRKTPYYTPPSCEPIMVGKFEWYNHFIVFTRRSGNGIFDNVDTMQADTLDHIQNVFLKSEWAKDRKLIPWVKALLDSYGINILK